MCARQRRESPKESDDTERPDVDEIVSDDSVDDASAMRVLRAKLTWREWLVRDFLRYWYWLAVLVVDLFVPWAAGDALGLWKGYRVIIVLAFVAALLAVELRLYFFLWPQGPWIGGRERRKGRFVKRAGIVDRILGRDED